MGLELDYNRVQKRYREIRELCLIELEKIKYEREWTQTMLHIGKIERHFRTLDDLLSSSKKDRREKYGLAKYCASCRLYGCEKVKDVDYGLIAEMLRAKLACPYRNDNDTAHKKEHRKNRSEL